MAITLLAINALILGVLVTPLTAVVHNIHHEERALFGASFGLTLVGAMVLVFPSTTTLSGGSLPSRQRGRRARAARALGAFGTLALAALLVAWLFDAPTAFRCVRCPRAAGRASSFGGSPAADATCSF